MQRLLSFACLLGAACAAPRQLQRGHNIVELAASVPDLSTLVTAIKAAGLVSTLEGAGPFTVFAPTNEAFAELPRGLLQKLLGDPKALAEVLTYHVVAARALARDLHNDEKIKTVEGSDVTAFLPGRGRVIIEGGEEHNYAEVVKADVLASNGVVHIIDHVLLPPRSPGPGPGPANKTIVDIAVADRDLSTLVAALKAAGLVDTLSGAGPFTVLAPTNRAFERLPRGVLDHLLRPENKAELAAVLTYHVVAGAAVQAKQLHKYERIATVEGANVTVVETYPDVVFEGGERENYARVERADVEASNGVVHIIDEVLLPPRGPAPPAPSPPSPSTVCKDSEFCCPDAKHCLTPTRRSCAAHACATGQTCCPLTKICVVVGVACESPCADQGSYCCPDAKHCLTPLQAGKFCTADTECDSFAPKAVCCPLTKLCVSVGAACTPPLTVPGFMRAL